MSTSDFGDIRNFTKINAPKIEPWVFKKPKVLRAQLVNECYHDEQLFQKLETFLMQQRSVNDYLDGLPDIELLSIASNLELKKKVKSSDIKQPILNYARNNQFTVDDLKDLVIKEEPSSQCNTEELVSEVTEMISVSEDTPESYSNQPNRRIQTLPEFEEVEHFKTNDHSNNC